MATIASLLRERVMLQVRSVDRIFLAANMPRLQSERLLVRFLLDRGYSIPSPAVLGKLGSSYVRAIERFARKHKVPVVHFKRGVSKEPHQRARARLRHGHLLFERKARPARRAADPNRNARAGDVTSFSAKWPALISCAR